MSMIVVGATGKSNVSWTHPQAGKLEVRSYCPALLTPVLPCLSADNSVVHHRHQNGRYPPLMYDAQLEHQNVAVV